MRKKPSSGIRPSPIFYAVVAAFAVGVQLSIQDHRLGVFVMVTAGWVLSLIFHEFAHAYVAFKGGDLSVAAKGYLTLNPLKYAHPLLSLGIPVVILLFSGLALPGGAVWIDESRLTDERRSAMSAAGPAANLLCALVCLAVLLLGILGSDAPLQILPKGSDSLINGLVLLTGFQILSVVFNLLPVPPLDGFGILEPTLSPQVRQTIAPLRQYGFFILFALIFFTPVGQYLWLPIEKVFEILGIDLNFFREGYFEYRFWENN